MTGSLVPLRIEEGKFRLLLLVQQHPRRPKPVAQHREPVREKRLLHFHEDLTTLAKQRVEPLRLLRAIHPQRQIRTAHRLGARDVRAHENRLPNLDARVQDRLLPVGRDAGLIPPYARHWTMRRRQSSCDARTGCVPRAPGKRRAWRTWSRTWALSSRQSGAARPGKRSPANRYWRRP